MNIFYLYFITKLNDKYVISKPLYINKDSKSERFICTTNYEWDYKHQLKEFTDIYNVNIFIIKSYKILDKNIILKNIRNNDLLTTKFCDKDIFMNNIFYKKITLIDYNSIEIILNNYLPYNLVSKIISYLNGDMAIYLTFKNYNNKCFITMPKLYIPYKSIKFIKSI